MPTTIRIAAALLIGSDGQTLLVRKRGTQAFMQPGGKIDAGEQPVEALARELRIEDTVESACFRRIAFNRIRQRLGCVEFEMTVLTQHGPEPANLPHQPLLHGELAAPVSRLQLATFFGEILQDRAALKNGHRITTVGRRMIK